MNKDSFSIVLRQDYKIYLEPLLATACKHIASKKGLTRSKYVRFAVINQLISDGYPLENIEYNKFGAFSSTLKYGMKERARRILNYNISTGEIIVPDICSKCGVKPLKGTSTRRRIHAHHIDYTKPLDVIWLCSGCHAKLPKTE